MQQQRDGLEQHQKRAASEKVTTFTQATGCPDAQQALKLLMANRWNMQVAAAAYYDNMCVSAGGNNPAGSSSGAAPSGWNSALAPPVSHPATRAEASAPK